MADAWFDELAEFLRIPSISADPAHAGDVARAGEWVCDFVRGAGGECELVDWHGQPLAIGEIRASHGARARRPSSATATSTCSRRDPLELWESDPFEPEIRDGYLYGRGTVDDKGQLYMLLSAARELARAGELPVNVRFCCDGEEETGGHSIVEFLEADERGADAAIIFDSGMIRRDVPAFNARDARHRLLPRHAADRRARPALGHLRRRRAERRARADRRRSTASSRTTAASPSRCARASSPPTEEELAGWRELPTGADELAEQGARPTDPRAAEEFYLRTFAEPALDVNGIESGSPHLQKTVLPVEAVANVSIRLAPGQEVEEIAPEVERLLREAAPDGRRARDRAAGRRRRPGSCRPDATAIQLGLDAFERVARRAARR